MLVEENRVTDLRKLLTEGEIKKAHNAVIEDDYLWEDLIGFLDDSDSEGTRRMRALRGSSVSRRKAICRPSGLQAGL